MKRINVTIPMENITVEGRSGTWYSIRTIRKNGKKIYQMESEQYGDMSSHILIDENNKELVEEYNQDLYETYIY